MLQGTHGDFSGRSAWHCSAAAASCSPTGAGRIAAPGPAAHTLDGQLGSQNPHRATALHLPQGLGETESKLNTALLDWMEAFSLLLCKSGERIPAVAGAPCTFSPVPPALCLKRSLTSASPKRSPQEQPAPSLCAAIFPCFHFCSSALI